MTNTSKIYTLSQDLTGRTWLAHGWKGGEKTGTWDTHEAELSAALAQVQAMKGATPLRARYCTGAWATIDPCAQAK